MKRKNILDAALKLVITNGVHATPMSAIAKAANTGMGTIYNYFANKDLLINAIYLDIKQQEEALILAPTNKRTVKSQFEYYYILVIDFYMQNPDYYRFMDQLQSSPIITEENRKEAYKAIEPVISILEKGQKEGLIKKIPIEDLLQFIGGVLLAHVNWLLQNETRKTDKTNLNNRLRLVWDAIKK